MVVLESEIVTVIVLKWSSLVLLCSTLKCLSIGMLKTTDIPFVPKNFLGNYCIYSAIRQVFPRLQNGYK